MLVYFGVMPLLIRFSVSLQQVGQPGEATIELLPKVSEYLSLIMTLVFAFGAAFQLAGRADAARPGRHHQFEVAELDAPLRHRRGDRHSRRS